MLKNTSAKILVIDDDAGLTELISVTLKTHGFDVVATNSGMEGVNLAKEKKPAVVILDLMMPDFDGWQVSKAIRAFSDAPILILSAVSDPNMVASILDAGADDFLIKPVPSNLLVAHVRKMVRQISAPVNIRPAVSASLPKKPPPLLS